ncbi:hypothetical protein Tco_1195964 [Tanacetum coccineum]
MVAYLQKSEGSEGFHQIIEFLNASHIQYALIENPTIYVSFIKQFWRSTTAITSTNGEIELTATIDGQVKTITEASLRRYLKLEDNGGVTTLPNSEIFEQLALMGYKTDSDKLTFQKGYFQPHNKLGGRVGTNQTNLWYCSYKIKQKGKEVSKKVKTSQSRRRTIVVLSDEEEVSEDPSKHGRSLIEELDMDVEISLTAELIEEPTELVEDQGSGEKGEQEVITADIAPNTASVPISTASATLEVSTVAANLVIYKRVVEKRKDKGKAIMIEGESVQKKFKKKLEQEMLSHKEAIRLQEQIDEEKRKKDYKRC